MEPEETPNKKGIFLKIALGIFVIFILLATTAYILTARKNAREAMEKTNTVPVVGKIYTPEEKEQLAKDFFSSALPNVIPIAEKERRAKAFIKNTQTAISIEEKNRRAQELMTTNQF